MSKSTHQQQYKSYDRLQPEAHMERHGMIQHTDGTVSAGWVVGSWMETE